MDASNTLICAYVIYWYLILHFGNIETLSSSMWALNLQIILCIVVGTSVQLYHARRVLIVTQSIICVIAIVVLVTIGCVTSIFIAAKQSSLKRFSGVHSSWLTCVGLSTVALGDILVATSICWCLYQKRTRIARTRSVLVTIVAYSIISSLLTSLIGVATTVSFIVLPTSPTWLAFLWATSKCYVNSLLAMLNVRDYVRDQSTPGKTENVFNLSSLRVGPSGEAGLFVSMDRSTTLPNCGPNRSDRDEEPTFEDMIFGTRDPFSKSSSNT
ncbi:hypothetical protein EDB92DRAFT_1890559 [Lactarius akahatsu]|uniref:DUF6534 domain-containing protein n=1 Tax=Lactarius akahatsu TaxID=416441 RepID=A0AAD4L9B4_9AGAM|nr:hypothetical protein EDB92DRAFT_1890559 [Lactarius akahatsu]